MAGGKSGIWSKNFPSRPLKVSRESAPLTDVGRHFQSLGALTENDCSLIEITLAGTPRGTEGTVAVTPDLVSFSVSVKEMPMSLLARSFRIFQVCMIKYISLPSSLE